MASVASFTGSAAYWQPVARAVAAYGRLAPGDISGRLMSLHNLGTAIAAWRANQATNLWLSSTDRAKANALAGVDALIETEWRDVVSAAGTAANALTTADLGNHLDTVFRTSARPEHGLVVAGGLPEDRLRAALQIPGHEAALTILLARTSTGVRAILAPARAWLARLSAELASPDTAGVTASSATREADVKQILTPPATRSARAAAVAAGAPPPSFIAANYYEDLVPALHAQMLRYWAWAEPMDARAGLDVTPGGHVEGIAEEAKARVDALYGRFGSAGTPRLSFNAGTLQDRGTIVGDPYDMTRWMVREGAGQSPVGAVQTAHHSFENAAASRAIEDRLIEHYSGRSNPTAAGEQGALAALGVPATERARRLQIIDRMWPGAASRGRVSVAARQGATVQETRAIYWGLFKTMIHEYLHTTEHRNYRAWYSSLRDSHHLTTFQEGFTDLFTLRAWRSVARGEIAANEAFRKKIQGPADGVFDSAAVGGAPGHYAELNEAQQIEALMGEANMKAGFFRGNTAVLSGSRLPT
ncbi:hypothetical protein MWU75_06055 [Ornithinimicrobium sp. F0845]|uniref:hypothetical protein n=1 Tax=Ornithinimicrobium sp. F0845 TaxID=2926412 RepID=UPI001FF2E6CE|nr:hypothetical protein [Ornithinimicrobium sp. F0845]MCK0111698.1 hypothetical protein [Ornithinimicrobium sp. F0845]